MYIRLFLVWCFLFCCSASWAQSDGSAWINEQINALKASKKEEFKPIIDKIASNWSAFAPDEQEKLIKIVEQIQAKKLPVSPYVSNFLLAIIAFNESSFKNNQFDGWHAQMMATIKTGAKTFDTYNLIIAGLFRNKTLYETKSIRWRAEQGDFELQMQAGTPVAVFKDLDLICTYFNDSIVIKSTSGVAELVESKWQGKKGIVDWLRHNMPSDSLFVTLKQYDLSLKSPELNADTVLFTNATMKGKPLMGSFNDKCVSQTDAARSSYPRFRAFQAVTIIPNIFENINYKGQFSIEGDKYFALGTETEDAIITFLGNNKKPTLQASSKKFTIKKTDIVSEYAAASIYLKSDSIFHPGLNMKFDTQKRNLLLYMEANSLNKANFSNSYHKLDVNCDALSWNIDEPIIRFRMLTGRSDARVEFTSENYFSMADFRAIQGVTTYHPLTRLKNYYQSVGSKIISADGFAASLNLTLAQARSLIIQLSEQGFIQYNRNKEEIIIQSKLDHFVDASARKKDYDIVQVQSRTKQKDNGELDINKLELKINGVPAILLSDSHQVYVIPREGEVRVGKNRNMEFAGRLKAGPLDFYGKGFTFNYEQFTIDMKDVDSLRFQLLSSDKDERGRRKAIDIKTTFEKISGQLFIDDPRNRSGRAPLKKFPIFTSTSESFVFYDHPAIQKGVYSRSNFFFKVEPFTIDSLDEVTATQGLEFPGTLVSAKIFPDIKETLRVQPDTSLGFVTNTGKEGKVIYGGKGRYYNTIYLNGSGLTGSGRINYVSSNSLSQRFNFLPDSTNAQVDSFRVTAGLMAGVRFPQVDATDAYAHWVPYKDTMYVYSRRDPINMYGNKGNLTGELIYTPKQVMGKGSMELGIHSIASNSFNFSETQLKADSTGLKLIMPGTKTPAFATDAVKADINMQTMAGAFKSFGEYANVNMPFNQYDAELKEFYWDLKNDTILLGSLSQNGKAETRFKSTNPEMQGLDFLATSGSLNLKTNKLSVSGVQEMVIADALIKPFEGRLAIGEGGKPERLINATILLNETDKFHTIYNATVDVANKKKFSGEGLYDYTNRTGKKQTFTLNAIYVNDSLNTIGSAQITETDFYINPGFAFKGAVEITGLEKGVRFIGTCRLSDMPGEYLSLPFKINTFAEANKPYMPIKKYEDASGNPLYVGFLLNKETMQIYPSFVNTKQTENDVFIANMEGGIFFDEAKKTYAFGTVDRFEKLKMGGPYMVINPTNGNVTGEAKIDFGFKTNQLINLAGIINYSPDDRSFKVEGLASMKFNASKDALKMMSGLLLDSYSSVPDLKMTKPTVLSGLISLYGKTVADSLFEEIKAFNAFPNTGIMANTFNVADLNLSWDANNRAFLTEGRKLGIGSIGEEVVGRDLPGGFEVNYFNETGTEINITLDLPGGEFFFFTLKDNEIAAIASDNEFNTAIWGTTGEVKGKKSKKKKKGDVVDANAVKTIGMGATDKRDELLRKLR